MGMREVPSDVGGASAGAVREQWDEHRQRMEERGRARRVACAEWLEGRGIPVSLGVVEMLLRLRELDPAISAGELEAEARTWVERVTNAGVL